MTGIEVVVHQGGALLAKKFRNAVIERWSRYRAEQFFQSFVQELGIELGSETPNPEVDAKLGEIFADEKKSEIMFDAYRRVCLSKSKDIGPKIIGRLTGALVIAGRRADEGEECIFTAAEIMSDEDLIEFMKYFEEEKTREKKSAGIHFKEDRPMTMSSTESDWANGRRQQVISPTNLIEVFGAWAAKLQQVGLLSECIRYGLRAQPAISSDGIENVETSVTTTITFAPACHRLSRLVRRSL